MAKQNIPTYILLISVGILTLLAVLLAYLLSPRLADEKIERNSQEDIEYTFPENRNSGLLLPNVPKRDNNAQPIENDDRRVCIQVQTPAYNPTTGETRIFPTPCDVPKDWEQFSSETNDLQ